MTENERVRELRLHEGLTMEAFGNRVGVSRSAISNIESGNRAVTDQMLHSICREFRVNEQWLRIGEGEMFAPEPADLIAQVASEFNLSSFDEDLIREYASLPEDVRKDVYDMIMRLAAKHAPGTYPKLDDDIEAEIESYRRELLNEQDTEMSSASPEDAGIA